LTHDLWEELGRQIHIFLSSVTLADVVDKRVLGASRLDLSVLDAVSTAQRDMAPA
jgi:Rrf2 family iron-sulfur cluster assembly transcriptional regulator